MCRAVRLPFAKRAACVALFIHRHRRRRRRARCLTIVSSVLERLRNLRFLGGEGKGGRGEAS